MLSCCQDHEDTVTSAHVDPANAAATHEPWGLSSSSMGKAASRRPSAEMLACQRHRSLKALNQAGLVLRAVRAQASARMAPGEHGLLQQTLWTWTWSEIHSSSGWTSTGQLCVMGFKRTAAGGRQLGPGAAAAGPSSKWKQWSASRARCSRSSADSSRSSLWWRRSFRMHATAEAAVRSLACA